METLTFVAALTKSIAWPLAVLILVLMLRKPLRELIPLLRKLKYKELEMEFAKEIAELKAEAVAPDQPVPAAPAPEVNAGGALSQTKRSVSRRDDLLRMVNFSTRVAIMEAWLELEAAAIEVASSFWNVPPSDAFNNYPRLGEYLVQCKVIDHKQLEIFKKLQDLRNKAAHAQELNLSENDARSYVELATALAAHIRVH